MGNAPHGTNRQDATRANRVPGTPAGF